MRCNHLLWVAEGQEMGYPGTQMKSEYSRCGLDDGLRLGNRSFIVDVPKICRHQPANPNRRSTEHGHHRQTKTRTWDTGFTFVVILDKHDCSLQKISGDSTEDEALLSQVFGYKLI